MSGGSLSLSQRGETVKAIVRRQYGSAESLQFEDVPTPELGESDVLIKVAASSVNPLDWHLMRGEPYLLRLSYGIRRPKKDDVGIDVAGTVTGVGNKVTHFKIGDEVFGQGVGTLAEFARASESRLAIKPAEMSFEFAASIPCAGITALQALRDKGGVKRGDTVLVNGAAGGVGTFAVQIAKSLGATVTGVCSTTNVELIKSVGASDVVDYTKDDFSRQDRTFDVVIDAVGNRTLHSLRRALAPRGTLVVVGGGTGKWIQPMKLLLKSMLVSPFVRQRLASVMANIATADLDVLSALAVSGQIVPVVDRTYSLSEAADAIAYLERGHAKGKVVVTPA
jgi:NADPH:quinone reductase-like Zn-dependent oxidoreductase